MAWYGQELSSFATAAGCLILESRRDLALTVTGLGERESIVADCCERILILQSLRLTNRIPQVDQRLLGRYLAQIEWIQAARVVRTGEPATCLDDLLLLILALARLLEDQRLNDCLVLLLQLLHLLFEEKFLRLLLNQLLN